MPTFEIFAITLGLTLVLFYWVWIFAMRVNNFSVIDAAWSFAFFVHAIVFYNLSSGATFRKLLFLGVIGLWSLRLGFYLTKRIKSHHPLEDTRYIKLREDYGDNYENRFLYFFLMQAASVSFLTFPAIFVFNNPSENLSLFEVFGVIFFFLSLAGEALADAQISRFKLNPANKGKVCNVGLWKYSRHPNYFFESCIWFSYFVFWLGTDSMWWSLYAPLCILLLLLKVTGVPPSEAQSLKSRGDAYREYQRKTSIFVPWFPKN